MNLWTQLAAFSFIETEYSFLRPILFGDAESLYKIASNPDNTEFIFPTESSLQESEYVIANYFMKNPLGIWAICDKDSEKMIGSIKFEKIDEIKGEAELGYFLRHDYWGHGLMTECVKNIVYLAFTQFDLKRLYIITHLENKASQRVAEKTGFSCRRQFKGSDRYTRKMRDYLEFCYEKGDFHE